MCSLYYPLVVSVLEKRGLFILYRFINGFVFRNQVVGARRRGEGGSAWRRARAGRRGPRSGPRAACGESRVAAGPRSLRGRSRRRGSRRVPSRQTKSRHSGGGAGARGASAGPRAQRAWGHGAWAMAGLARSTAERERDPVLEFVKKTGVDVV